MSAYFREENAMKILIYLILTITILSLAGCQATPTSPAVINKASSFTELQDNEDAAYAFPATWSETVQYANFEVDIDAEIRADGNAPYSIWEAEVRDFIEKDVYDFVERVLPGKQLYEYSHEPTKEEYERTIQEIGRMLTETKERSPETYNDIAGEWLDYAGQLAMEMENAGPSRETTMESCRFRQDDGMLGSCLKIKVDNGKNMLSSIVARNSEYETSFSFNNYNYAEEPFQYSIPCPDEAKGGAYDTALAAGDSFIQSLGLTDYSLFDVALTPHGTKSWVFATPESPSGEIGYYYTLYYTRTIDGVPVTYVDDESIMGDKPAEEAYAAPIRNESILLQIDDTGVVQFIWEHPITIGRQETRAALLPWEAIQETMKKQMRYEKEADPRFGILTRKYGIDHITLGYALIRNRDGGYRLLPVWDFFGTLQQQFARGTGDPANMDANNVATVDTYGLSFLTINGMDGSIIDRRVGY